MQVCDINFVRAYLIWMLQEFARDKLILCGYLKKSSQERSSSEQGEYNALAPRLGYIGTHPSLRRAGVLRGRIQADFSWQLAIEERPQPLLQSHLSRLGRRYDDGKTTSQSFQSTIATLEIIFILDP